MKKMQFLLALYICTSFYLPILADLTDELDDYVDYTVIASKTIDYSYDPDAREEKDDSFTGCSYGKIIVFTDGTTLTCNSYGYQYAYRPRAILLARQGRLAMIVGDEIYDMRR